jgi:DNA-binding transcriptional ArsR family regulator
LHAKVNSPVPQTTDLEQYRDVFSALSEPIRLDIVRQIADVEELPCTALDESLPVSKSTISYHVKLLRHANLISVRKDGRNYFYTVKRDVFEHFVPNLLERLAHSGDVIL